MRRASFLIGLWLMIGCATTGANHHADQNELSQLRKHACGPSQMEMPPPRWPPVPIQWPTCPPQNLPYVPPQWPTYVAKDYDVPGHPALTSNEIAMLREALRKVKPCQRDMLRYAFPSNAKSGIRFVVFFEPWITPTHPAHVFWTSDVYFKWNGKVFVTRRAGATVRSDIRYDIERTPCTINGTENGAPAST